MKKAITILVILLNLSNTLYAQSYQSHIDLKIELDTMFSKMELNRVPTRLLLDRAIEYTNIRKYNGKDLSDSTVVNKDNFIDIIRTINSCSVSNTHLINEDLLLNKTDNMNNVNGQINIVHTLFRYNYIKENALTGNLISYDGKYAYDLYNENGEWINPYNTDIVFAMAPTSIVSKELTVQFNILNNLQLRNVAIVDLLFDADDGKGFKHINPMYSCTILIRYNDYGIKNIKLKAILNDGNSVISHSKIFIRDYPLIHKSNTFYESFKIDSIPHLTTLCNNKVGVYYHSTHGDGSIRKPLIIAEGFDPWQLTKYIENFTIPTNLTNKNGFTNYDDIVSIYYRSNLYKNYYDLVYIDWYDCYANIKENADYLIEIIEYINNQKAYYNSEESNIIMGQSMGGLIARYALRKMERQNKPHQVTTYVSHDSPHLGANVPLGAQYFIHQLISLSNNYSTAIWATNLLLNDKISDAEKDILNTLHSESAKQMLINYVDQTGQLNSDFYNDWQNELNNIGFPQGDHGIGIENIAIVNGDVFNLSELTKNTDDHLFAIYANASTSFWSSLLEYIVCNKLRLQYLALFLGFDALAFDMSIPGNADIKAIAEVNPFTESSYNKTLSKLKITYTKHILWIKGWTKTVYIFNSDIHAPCYGKCYDDYYGSIYSLTSEDEDKDDNEDDNDKNDSPDKSGWAGTYNIDTLLVDKIMFIPTTSALAMGNSLTDYNNKQDYRTHPPIPDMETPFNSYYFVKDTGNYKEHIHINMEVFNWISDQANLRINGPDIVIDSAKYTYSGGIAGLTWKSSDDSIASIDNNGVLTVKEPGVVTIEVSGQYHDNNIIRKTKKILAGYPDLYITYEYIMENGYLFTANIENEEYKKMLQSIKGLQYEWTIIDGNGNTSRFDTKTNSINYIIEEDDIISISVRLKVNNEYLNRTPKSITLDLKTPFEVNYKYVIVTANDNIYYIKSDGTYDMGAPDEDFSIRFRNLPLDGNDNKLNLLSQYLGNASSICYLAYNDKLEQEYKILAGTKTKGEYKWTFPLFDSELFINLIDEALGISNIEATIDGDFELKICNSEHIAVQSTPFAIIYKPIFM